MDYHQRIITDIESHSVEGIKECFRNGVDANEQFRGEPLFNELTSEYARTPQFAQCVRAFIDAGLRFDNRELLAVLADDAPALEQLLKQHPEIRTNTYSLRCAYTPLFEATLLHVCAEFNHVTCAKVLIRQGVDVDARAGVDEHGFGGQTPIFHTVNQNHHNSAEMMELLLAHGADAKLMVTGLIWGEGVSVGDFRSGSERNKLCNDGTTAADAQKGANNIRSCIAVNETRLWHRLYAF